MQSSLEGGRGQVVARGRQPVGAFLDHVPTALYVAAHIIFLAVAAWLWLRATDNSLPYSGSLLLYAASQLAFLAFFANYITMKTAVLAEQMLVVSMLLVIVLRAS